MQINITGHHVELTDALREYVNKKLNKLTRHFDSVTNVHVVLTVEKQEQKAEVKVNATGQEIVAQASSQDMYASIDAMMDKLDRQVIKHKEKMGSHNQKSGGVKNMTPDEEE